MYIKYAAFNLNFPTDAYLSNIEDNYIIMETIFIQINHDKAYQLLKTLEELELIKIIETTTNKAAEFSDSDTGKFPSEVADDMHEYIKKGRSEWNDQHQDLQELLIEKIRQTDDNILLEEARRLLDADIDDQDVYVLSEAEKARIEEGREQIRNGETLSNEEANQLISEWLKK